MKILRNLRISRQALLAHPLRTCLALSGVAIGVAAVILTTAIGEGAEREVLGRIRAMGTNLLVVTAGPVKKLVGRRVQTSRVTTLTLEDHEALAETFPWISRSAPTQDRTLKVRYADGAMMTKILGTTPEFADVRNFELRQGRLFTEEENRASFRVAVLGARVFDTLFEGADPIRETIRLRGIPFEVIGVLEAKGVSADSDEDNQVLIPIQTALRRSSTATTSTTSSSASATRGRWTSARPSSGSSSANGTDSTRQASPTTSASRTRSGCSRRSGRRRAPLDC